MKFTFKKAIGFILALAIISSLSATMLSAAGNYYSYGDVDKNDKINLRDTLTIQLSLVEQITLDNLQKIIGDVDGNEKITTKDAVIIQRYIAEQISSFPVGDKYYDEITIE